MAITIGIIFGILAMLGWGLADFISKKVVDRIGAHKGFIFSYIFGVIPVVIYFMFFPQLENITNLIILLFIFGSLVNFLGYFYFYKGLEVEKLSIVAPIVASNPAIIVLLSIIVLKEIVSLNQGLGITFVIGGLILASIQSRNFKIDNKKGILFGIFSMLTWGVAIFILGYLARNTSWIFAVVVFRSLTWAYGLIIFKSINIPLNFPKFNLFYLLIPMGLLDVLGTVFYTVGVTTELISLVGPISALYPFVSLMLARIILKEKLILIQKIGIIGILFGLFLISI